MCGNQPSKLIIISPLASNRRFLHTFVSIFFFNTLSTRVLHGFDFFYVKRSSFEKVWCWWFCEQNTVLVFKNNSFMSYLIFRVCFRRKNEVSIFQVKSTMVHVKLSEYWFSWISFIIFLIFLILNIFNAYFKIICSFSEIQITLSTFLWFWFLTSQCFKEYMYIKTGHGDFL